MRMKNRGLGHLMESGRAGMRVLELSVVLVAALAAGCAHSSKSAKGGPQPVPQPPLFLTGPMALLLTNVDGFRARVVLEEGASARQIAAGELMGRSDSLIFAPSTTKAQLKRASAAGSAFIWNVPANGGYMLTDPLQAYAPISSGRQFTNLMTTPPVDAARPEKIAGYRCQPSEMTVAANDGTVTAFRAWRAADLKGLPLRITCNSKGTTLTLTLSRARLETLPADLFEPPAGFTRYESSEALVAELTARQNSLRRKPSPQLEETESLAPPSSRGSTP
jgi:hypothetical protein